MFVILKYCLILTIIHFSQSCEPLYKKVDRDIDENSLVRYPWLVTIRNIRDDVFRLCYGSLIHPKAVLTSSRGLIGHTNNDIVVETNCQDSKLIGTLENCIIRNVSKVINQSNVEDLHNIANFYSILILETSFDLTDRIKPIRLASNTNIFSNKNCLYTRWIREYSTTHNRTGRVTAAYNTSFNDGQLNIENLDKNQIILDKDRLISKLLHTSFNESIDDNLRVFIGSPLVCKLNHKSLDPYVQVGIAAFYLNITDQKNIKINNGGILINTVPLYCEIMKKVNENI